MAQTGLTALVGFAAGFAASSAWGAYFSKQTNYPTSDSTAVRETRQDVALLYYCLVFTNALLAAILTVLIAR